MLGACDRWPATRSLGQGPLLGRSIQGSPLHTPLCCPFAKHQLPARCDRHRLRRAKTGRRTHPAMPHCAPDQASATPFHVLCHSLRDLGGAWPALNTMSLPGPLSFDLSSPDFSAVKHHRREFCRQHIISTVGRSSWDIPQNLSLPLLASLTEASSGRSS